MKILFINPPKVNGISVIREDRCEITERITTLPPYSMLQMAAVLRDAGYNVDLIDANGANISYTNLQKKMNSIHFDVLIFRFTPTTFFEDIKVARLAKTISKNIFTVGLCWTLKIFAKKIIKDYNVIDFYAKGDYITTVPDLINCLNTGGDLTKVSGIVYKRNKDIIETDDIDINFNYDELPIPAYDLLPSLENYFVNTRYGTPYTIIYSSKGCPYGCIYCTVSKTKWAARSAENILEEIRYLKNEYNLKSLTFFDETFTYDRGRVIDICQKLMDEKLDIFWYCNTRSNKLDLELLKLMKKAGCRGISLGIESGSQRILNNARKGITVEQNEIAIANAKSVGIKTYCSFIFGLPGEDKSSINETINFVKKNLPNGGQFNVVVPYPGTKLFDIAVEKGWISPDIDWTKLYQHNSIIKTDDLSMEDLDKARRIAYKSLYFNPKWILMNVLWVLRYPNDLILATKFYLKSIENYILYDMRHSH